MADNAGPFLSKILPPIHTSANSYFVLGLKPKQRPVMAPCISIDQLVSSGMRLSNEGYNAYFATALYTDYSAGRKAVNVESCKCFWADIDAGKKDSKYKDKREALEAVVNFSQLTKFKPTIIVSSGAGLHVYWVLTEVISAADWVQVASIFQYVCADKNLDVDPARARDLASVLRIPGTLHQKSGNTVEIIFDSGPEYTPEEFIQILKRYATSVPPSALARRASGGSVQESAMKSIGMISAPTVKAERVVTECQQIATMGTGKEPHWFKAMSVLKRCVDGREWTHKLSAMDTARYDQAQTDAKFDRAPEDMPGLCQQFNLANPGVCPTCQHWGAIRSPIQIAKLPSLTPVDDEEDETEPVVLLDLAAVHQQQRYKLQTTEFVVDQRGIVHRRTTKDELTGQLQTYEDVICQQQLYYLYSVRDTSILYRPERAHMFEVVNSKNERERVMFSIGQDMTQQRILQWFNNAGMMPTSSAYGSKVFMAFMNAYLSTVAQNTEELPAQKTFGWGQMRDPVTKQDAPAFYIGPGAVTESGLHPVHYKDAAGDIAQSEYTYAGTLDEWKKIAEMYMVLDQPIAQFAISLSIATPLMRFALGDASNAIFSLWSDDGGRGKTHVLKAAASVWGNPSAQLISRMASSVARGRKLAVIKNLPAFMDEMTDVAEEDMFGLAYMLTEGREKNKLKASGAEFIKTGTWDTVSFITANRSFKQAIASKAGSSNATLLRVLEYECDFKSYNDDPVTRQYINDTLELLKTNYGLVGPMFIHALMQHTDRIATLPTFINHWAAQHGFAQNERFLYNPIAVAIEGARWAVQWGLLPFDVDYLERWAVNEFMHHVRGETSRMVVKLDSAFGEFLNAMILHTLVVKGKTRLKTEGEVPAPDIKGLPDPYLCYFPPREIFVRVHLRESIMYVSRAEFNRWMRKNSINPNVVISYLVDHGVHYKQIQRRLTSGITWLPMTASCVVYEFKLDELTKIGVDHATAVLSQAGTHDEDDNFIGDLDNEPEEVQ